MRSRGETAVTILKLLLNYVLVNPPSLIGLGKGFSYPLTVPMLLLNCMRLGQVGDCSWVDAELMLAYRLSLIGLGKMLLLSVQDDLEDAEDFSLDSLDWLPPAAVSFSSRPLKMAKKTPQMPK